MRLLYQCLRWQPALRTFSHCRSPRLRLIQSFKHPPGRRFKHEYGNPENNQHKIGERVLLYHAGVFLTTFVGVLQVSIVGLCFVKIGDKFVTLWQNFPSWEPGPKPRPRFPLWWIGASILLGFTTLFATFWIFSPFVASATLKNVPPGARRSLDHLYRWAEKMPYDCEIEFKMFTWYGFFYRTVVPIGELKTKNPGFLRSENLVRWTGGGQHDPKRFLVMGERKSNLRKRLWNIIYPQLGPVEAVKK